MLPLLLEAGVDISRLERNTRRGLNTVWTLFNAEQIYCIVSSTYEGDHIAGSLHYGNQAFDIYPPAKVPMKLLTQCRDRLGQAWDIIDKPDHWHFEFDPD